MAAPHLSPSVRVGDVVYTSGQVALRGGKIKGDISAQTKQVIANLEEVLAAHGLGLAAIVKTTVWLKHQADYAKFNATYAAAFGEHRPARSTTVAELALPEALVEIEAVARMGAAW